MKWTTDIEDRFDEIRDKINEKIKDMSSSERTAYFNAALEEGRKKYNFQVVKAPKKKETQAATQSDPVATCQ